MEVTDRRSKGESGVAAWPTRRQERHGIREDLLEILSGNADRAAPCSG